MIVIISGNRKTNLIFHFKSQNVPFQKKSQTVPSLSDIYLHFLQQSQSRCPLIPSKKTKGIDNMIEDKELDIKHRNFITLPCERILNPLTGLSTW